MVDLLMVIVRWLVGLGLGGDAAVRREFCPIPVRAGLRSARRAVAAGRIHPLASVG